MELSHINAAGEANMVDVGAKEQTERSALASGVVLMQSETLAVIKSDGLVKGNVLAVARVAGIQAAKKCSDLIPLCHPIPLEDCKIDIEFKAPSNNGRCDIIVTCSAVCSHKTGVEMEALVGASVASLCIYDMTKALSHDIVIRSTRLISKTGGKRDFHRT